ncbi:hypothetical protein PV325_008590 [Microctonus aethiopoides]|nr:hypothetical protein PV325_008590 [Microctonus aethiopoides]
MANLAWWLPGGRNWEIERTGKSFYCIPFPCSGKGNYARSGLPIAVGFNHEASEPYNIPPPSLCVLTLYTFWRIAELKMDVLREREVKDSLERQLQDEQKTRVVIMNDWRVN